jgi:hypothetical protein
MIQCKLLPSSPPLLPVSLPPSTLTQVRPDRADDGGARTEFAGVKGDRHEDESRAAADAQHHDAAAPRLQPSLHDRLPHGRGGCHVMADRQELSVLDTKD